MWDNSMTEFQEIIQIYYFLSPSFASFTIFLFILFFPIYILVLYNKRQIRVLLYEDYVCQVSIQKEFLTANYLHIQTFNFQHAYSRVFGGREGCLYNKNIYWSKRELGLESNKFPYIDLTIAESADTSSSWTNID